MPNLTLRQAVMLSQQMHFGKEGDQESLMDAAMVLGAKDPHALGGMDEANERLRRADKTFAAKMDALSRTLEGFVGTDAAAGLARTEVCEKWIDANADKYPDGINVPALGR